MRLMGCPGGFELTREPFGAAGAQVIALTPAGCAVSMRSVSQEPSGWYVRMEMVPSEDAAARMRPSSKGAHAMLFTDAVWRVDW